MKLRQFDPADRTHVVIPNHLAAPVRDADRPGVTVLPLFDNGREAVRLEKWEPGAEVSLAVPGGLELFVVEGNCIDHATGGEALRRWDWLSLPPGDDVRLRAGVQAARVWINAGHLRELC